MPRNIIEVRDVELHFGAGVVRTRALHKVCAEFPSEQMTLVTGPSGSGKTSLLSIAGCLLQPDSGTVLIEGNDVSVLSEDERAVFRRKYIGFVFQGFRLFESLSARENVALMGQISENGRSRAEDLEIAETMLDRFGLRKKANLKPREMSGGERQRVGIARALFHRPKVILADEPTASLDSFSGKQVMETLRNLVSDLGVTVAVVSHDARWKESAHQVIELEDGTVK